MFAGKFLNEFSQQNEHWNFGSLERVFLVLGHKAGAMRRETTVFVLLTTWTRTASSSVRKVVCGCPWILCVRCMNHMQEKFFSNVPAAVAVVFADHMRFHASIVNCFMCSKFYVCCRSLEAAYGKKKACSSGSIVRCVVYVYVFTFSSSSPASSSS